MARTSISLPDHLVGRLQPLKQQINISHICRAALEAKLQTHEQIQIALSEPDLKAGLIKRLKLQKAESDHQSYHSGGDDGLRWAFRQATYAQLCRWGPAEAPETDDKEKPPWDLAEWSSYGVADDQMAYRRGFLDAVRGIWAEIKDEWGEFEPGGIHD